MQHLTLKPAEIQLLQKLLKGVETAAHARQSDNGLTYDSTVAGTALEAGLMLSESLKARVFRLSPATRPAGLGGTWRC